MGGGDGTCTSGADAITFDNTTNTFSVWGSHSYAEESSANVRHTTSHTDSMTVDRAAAHAAAVTSSATVDEVAAVVTGGQSVSAVEGALCNSQVVATFTDPGSPEDRKSVV